MKWTVRMADDLLPSSCRTSRKSGALTYPEPLGPVHDYCGMTFTFTNLSIVDNTAIPPISSIEFVKTTQQTNIFNVSFMKLDGYWKFCKSTFHATDDDLPYTIATQDSCKNLLSCPTYCIKKLEHNYYNLIPAILNYNNDQLWNANFVCSLLLTILCFPPRILLKFSWSRRKSLETPCKKAYCVSTG
jgi:hypothetical protein